MQNNVGRVEKTLKQLNSVSLHPRRKLGLNTMEENKKYPVLSARKTMKLNNSKKMVIRLEIDEFFIYLPKRFEQLPDFVWNEINDGGFEIVRLESHTKTKRLAFICTRPNETDKSHQFSTIEYLNSYIYSPSYKHGNDDESFTQSRDPIGQPNETFKNIQ